MFYFIKDGGFPELLFLQNGLKSKTIYFGCPKFRTILKLLHRIPDRTK